MTVNRQRFMFVTLVALLGGTVDAGPPQEGGRTVERRSKFEIRHRLVEVASDRPGTRKLVGVTTGLTLNGTLLAVASDTDLHLTVPTMAVVADRSLVLYFAKAHFVHKVESGRSTIYVPDGVPVPTVLLAP